MPQFRSDEIQWFNNGEWGKLGYATPNFGNDHSTLNGNIAYLVSVMGRNLSAVMHHRDADLYVPPTLNTLIRVHKLVTRGRSILASRAVAANQQRFEAVHATPAREPFIIFPVPYWKVRNPWLKEWAGLTLNSLSEAMQHTENGNEYEISTDFAGLIGQYLQRVYFRLSTELFQVPVTEAGKPDFTLTDVHFNSYNPGKFFTATELIDTPPDIETIPTEDDLNVLTNGIPATHLVGVMPFPRGLNAAISTANAAPTPVANSASFIPPPGP